MRGGPLVVLHGQQRTRLMLEQQEPQRTRKPPNVRGYNPQVLGSGRYTMTSRGKRWPATRFAELLVARRPRARQA